MPSPLEQLPDVSSLKALSHPEQLEQHQESWAGRCMIETYIVCQGLRSSILQSRWQAQQLHPLSLQLHVCTPYLRPLRASQSALKKLSTIEMWLPLG